MRDLLSLIDNALLQGLGYGLAVLGIALAFRVLRYPDLTADGSFVLGAVTFAAIVSAGGGWLSATAAAMAAGALAGLITAGLYKTFGVSRLLTGILTAMIAYSLAFRILGGQSNIGIRDAETAFSLLAPWDQVIGATWGLHLGQVATSLIVAALILLAARVLLRSEVGLLMRSSGANPALVDQLNRSHGTYQIIGLAFANTLVALAGVMVTARQGFADVNMGLGVIINLVAALVIGEEIMRRVSGGRPMKLIYRLLTPFIGGIAYFLLYLLILRASIRGWIPIQIQPTDLKMLSAIVVIAVVALRRARPGSEQILPL
mgnify:CR=1 FL=1|tara:strand:- start:4741 stop:5691 length:951 start_codon:yes stop_codon:yes gene_type:complete